MVRGSDAKEAKEKASYFRLTLRFTIAGLLIGLLVIALIGSVVIVMLVRSKSVEATSHSILNEISAGINERLLSRIEPAEAIVQEYVRAAELGHLQTDDMRRLAERLALRIRYDARFGSFAFLTPDDTGCGAMRLSDEVILLVYTESDEDGVENVLVREHLYGDDSRELLQREPGGMAEFQNAVWYELGAASEGPVWTQRYQRPIDGTWGRACAAPLRDGDRLLGVFGIGYGEAFMSEYIRGLKVAGSGRYFSLHAETGEITVSPSAEDLEIFKPVILEGASRIPVGVTNLTIGDPYFARISHAGVAYIVAFEMQRMGEMLRWINAIIVPEKELVGFLDRYVVAALIGIAILVLVAVIVAQLLSRRISRPLNEISSDLGRVAAFEITTDSAPKSLIREVAVVGDAVDRMKAGLRSFSRYVPTDLVRGLILDGREARLDGQLRPLTLFFSDVKGFTSVSEGMPPQLLVDALGDYLDALTKAAVADGGTIDKFMGDGVLAFFNAPYEDPDHAANACRAALRVQYELEKARPGWVEDGRPAFHTRIGLHTDEVVVGNIGTPERFAYTVLGDGVNLAARLESVNKVYGTWILASGTTRGAAGDGFIWRRIDRTAVAGKTEGVDIYELLGKAGDLTEESDRAINAYEDALAAYFDRRFDEALKGFTRALEFHPGDLAAEVLKQRCDEYANAPPPEDWNGIYIQTHK